MLSCFIEFFWTESLDQLQEWIVQKFSAIRRFDVPQKDFGLPWESSDTGVRHNRFLWMIKFVYSRNTTSTFL
jgi:hypothetical protein